MIIRFTIAFFLIPVFLCAGVFVSFHEHRVAAPLPSTAAGPSTTSFSGTTMGGTWSVKIEHLPPGVSAESLQKSAADLLATLDARLSIWRGDSELSHFNQYRGGDWFAVSKDLADVVDSAQKVSEATGGAFDVTVGPLVLLWGFGPRKAGGQVGQIPSDADISAARMHVGYKLLHARLSPPALKKDDPLVYVDLGGIAKGYAAQKVGGALESHGVGDYLVAVGGELRAHGLSYSGHPWRVGIETPTPDIRRIFYSLELKDSSLSTSGDYRNFFEINGTRYCHEIDPKTGRPIPGGLASVSIVHSSGAYADAMATALMVLGPREGMEFARRRGLAVFFIMRQSDHFETLFTREFDQLGGAGLKAPVSETDDPVNQRRSPATAPKSLTTDFTDGHG